MMTGPAAQEPGCSASVAELTAFRSSPQSVTAHGRYKY